MHSIVTTFRGADIKVEVANFCAAMDTLIDQDDIRIEIVPFHNTVVRIITLFEVNVCLKSNVGALQVN